MTVTWADHFISDAPDYDIDPAWLARVSEVADYAITNDLYAIINAHHDSWSWLNPDATGFDRTVALAKFYRLWYQVGTTLGCKSSLLAFETINEPSGNTTDPADGDFVNQLHANMVKAISDAGGFNADRVVILCGLSDGYDTAKAFLELPPNMTNPWALTWHMYGPWAFTAAAFGETLWGSDSDKSDMWNNVHWARTNFTDVPIIIGEFGIGTAQTEAAARWKYYDYFVQAAYNNSESVMLWDASGSFAPDTSTPYGDPTAMDVIISAAKGVQNALADSTEDENAPSFWSSAQLFQKQGDPIRATGLPMLFNGHTLLSISISNGTCNGTLRVGTDYAIDGQNVTFTQSFMQTLFPTTAEPGLRATMVFKFDGGAAPLIIPAYLWARPTLAVNQVTITNTSAQNDLWVPVTYRGMPEVAMVVAQEDNGQYLVDSWTEWLPPMLKGNAVRASFSFIISLFRLPHFYKPCC
jgi:endoglucanase